MSLKGLPNVLVTLLDTVSNEYQLSSWYTKGGSDFTTISLRFDHSAIVHDTVETAKYKKVSQNRVERDKSRAERWKSDCKDTGITQSDNDSNDAPNGRLQKDIATQADDIAPIPPAQCDQYHNAELATTNQSNMHDLENISITHMDTVAGADEIHLNESSIEISHGAVSKQTAVIQHGNTSSVADMLDSNDSSSESDESDDPIDIQCNICLESCNRNGNVWYKCTVSDDFDMCLKCHSSKRHIDHWGHIHKFEYPKDCSNGYCDSCGFVFRPHSSSFYVHRCQKCDDYAICKKCHDQDMHVKHAYIMERILASDYLAYLQGRGPHHGEHEDGGGG